MPDPVPFISIIVPTHNRRALMEQMLAALEAQGPETPPFELVVVADGCADGTQEMIAAHKAAFPITLVERPGVGPAKARNAGAAMASADILLFLDDDVLPTSGLVAAHWAAHRRAPGGVVIAPYPPAPHASRDLFRLRIRAWWMAHFDALARPGHRFGFRDLLTGNLSLGRALWQDVDGLDPQFAHAREDLELGVRLMERDVAFQYAPDGLGWHHEHHTSSLKGALRRSREEGRSDALMALKHPHLRPALLLSSGLRWRQPFRRRFTRLGATSALFEPLIAVGPAVLRLMAWSGLRGGYVRFAAFLIDLTYHRGGRQAIGGDWSRIAVQPSPPASVLTVDLAKGLSAAERTIAQTRPRAVRLMFGAEELGLLPDEPGCERWDGRHLREALLDRLPPACLARLTGDAWPAPGPAGWAAFNLHGFDLLYAEARRQWATVAR